MKLFVTAIVFVLVPTYIKTYGLQNFLWFSDIALFLIFFGLWLSSPLLMGIALLLTFLLETTWCIDYFYKLFTGLDFLGISNYMFNQDISIYTRALSLFHLLLPIVPIYYIYQWGYHEQTLLYSVFIFWPVMLICYFFTPIDTNINWVHNPIVHNWKFITPTLWITMILLLYPLLIMVPKNYLLMRVFATIK